MSLAFDVYGFREGIQVSGAHPLGFEVLADSLVAESKPPRFLNRVAVRFNLRGSFNIAVIRVEEFLSLHELSDVAQFVNQVQVNVDFVAGFYVA